MNFIKVLLLLTTFLNVACVNTSKQNQKAPNRTLLQSNDSSILVSSNQFSSYKTVLIENEAFQFVGSPSDTQYLSTRSNQFRTPEGYGVGMSLRDVNKILQDNLMKEPGWGYYIQLKSGWNLAFCEGNSCTDERPKESSTIDWIFKRK